MFRARELAAEYNRCHVFCLPSVQEGFGIVLLEAMAAGKPMVAARAGAIPEVAPHAALVEPDSAEALAAGIEMLYRSPERAVAVARRRRPGWSSSMLRAVARCSSTPRPACCATSASA